MSVEMRAPPPIRWEWDSHARVGVVEPETSTDGSGGNNGRFLSGNKCGRGTPLAGRAEKMRALLLQTAEKRIGEVLDVLFDLGNNERQAWAIKECLDRSLGSSRPATRWTCRSP